MRYLSLVFISIIAFAGVRHAINFADRDEIPKGLPPGYTIEVDNFGYYRACHNGRPLITLDDKQSKQEATERAWEQYHFELEEKARVWIQIKP
jgi:hypothetical protein